MVPRSLARLELLEVAEHPRLNAQIVRERSGELSISDGTDNTTSRSTIHQAWHKALFTNGGTLCGSQTNKELMPSLQSHKHLCRESESVLCSQLDPVCTQLMKFVASIGAKHHLGDFHLQSSTVSEASNTRHLADVTRANSTSARSYVRSTRALLKK